jgi:alpha-ketoglutarate-dependent taurine dioxygenase
LPCTDAAEEALGRLRRRGGYAAYEDLPERTKRRIDGLVALHHYGNRDDLDRGSRTVASVVHATQQKYQCRLGYGVGDLVIWDNASLLHSATLTDPDDPRTLWRITIKEEGTS